MSRYLQCCVASYRLTIGDVENDADDADASAPTYKGAQEKHFNVICLDIYNFINL